MNTVENNIEETEVVATPSFRIREVSSSAPVVWFQKGLDDFKRAPSASMLYGLMYIVIGMLTIWLTWENPLYVATMVAAFLLIGPIVAVGFYCISRSLERGEVPTFTQGIDAFKFNAFSLISFALVLVFIVGVWAVIATVLTAVFFSSATVGDDIMSTILANEQILPFAISYILIGAVFAIVAFSISVISVPLITNRRTDFVTAMKTSVAAVRKNPVAMISWALMISMLIFLGMAFFYVGLAITLPIVGHASWHAYRELIIDEES